MLPTSATTRLKHYLFTSPKQGNIDNSDDQDVIPTANLRTGAVGPGSQIGPYKLLNILGEGGFAVVYLAQQQRPVKRRVAVKVIKPGMDSKQVVARFEAERQALALLDHPNVAHVYDAGTTELGRPYFVMEHVKGVQITEHCDRHKLTVEERLELFMQVCDAVQHAHQKGIIHRDLKPSNILVFFEGQKALPKVIDFGVAKAISQPLTERTLVTEHGEFIGTPAYMSPEQAEMTTQDIDTRSDIYSLGVVLYELLTGALPFDVKTLDEGGVDHIRHVIREEEPKTPSTRLSSLGEDAETVAERRRTEVRTLVRRLKTELEWIPLKAMRKERTRRYRSASEMADDIQNYLSGNPLIAGPETTAYKVQKFVRRHAGSVVTVAIVAVTIVLGLLVSTSLYFKAEKAFDGEAAARKQAEQAHEKESIARTQAEQAERVAQEQRQRAEYLLARAQIERGVRLVNEGKYDGLLDLVDARATAEEIPDIRNLSGRLWAIAYELCQDRLVHVLPGAHNITYSPDGRLLAAVQGNFRPVRLFDTETGQPQGSPLDLGKMIHAVAFSPDGKLLVTHSAEGISRLWETATGQPAGPVLRHSGALDVAISSDQHNYLKHSAAFSPNGTLLATASVDGTVRLWKTDTCQPYGRPLEHNDWVGTVAFSPDGRLLASGSRETQLWDVGSGESHVSPFQHEIAVTKLVFSPDGKHVAAMGSWGDRVDILHTDTGELHQRLQLRLLRDGVFSPDARLFATASLDWHAQLWETASGQVHGEQMQHDGRVYVVAFSPNGRLLATGARDQTVRLWEVPSGQPYGRALRHPSERALDWVEFSPDGGFLASCAAWGTTRIWRTWQSLHTEVVSFQNGDQLGAVSPDGKVGAIVSGKTVQLWDTARVEALGKGLLHDANVADVVFSPDSRLLATTSWDRDRDRPKVVHLWDVATGRPLGPSINTDCIVLALSFSPDGKLLAIGSENWRAKVYEVATGRRLRSFSCDEWVLAVALRPDNKVLATALSSGTVDFWDVASGQRLGEPLQHEGGVLAAAYSPDGNILATVSSSPRERDRIVRLWDVSVSPPYHSLTLPSKAISERTPLQSFSSDGTLLVRRLPEGKARVWRLPVAPPDLREMQIRTWGALGADRGPQGQVTTIHCRQWQSLHNKLRAYHTRGPQASWPQPADGGDIAVSPDAKLRWMAGLDAVAHNVYFGISPEKLKLLGKVEDASYTNLPELEKHRWYCWRVDTVKSDGAIIRGNLWSFSTGKMVGWWKFDEAEGRKATDSSGFTLDGMLVGDPQWVVGYDANALELDGVDDYVETGYTTDLPAWTISVWVTSPAAPSSATQSGPVHREKNYQINWNHSNETFRGTAALEVGGTWYAASFGTLEADTWYHVAATYDGNVLKAYKNGSLITSNPSPSGNPTAELGTLKIGRHSLNAQYFGGTIDDVRIYSYVLSEDQIRAVYAGEGPGPIAKPEWVVDVSGQEHTPLEPDAKRNDVFYVPLVSEPDQEDEEVEAEILEIYRRVLGEEDPDTLYFMNTLDRTVNRWKILGESQEAE